MQVGEEHLQGDRALAQLLGHHERLTHQPLYLGQRPQAAPRAITRLRGGGVGCGRGCGQQQLLPELVNILAKYRPPPQVPRCQQLGAHKRAPPSVRSLRPVHEHRHHREPRAPQLLQTLARTCGTCQFSRNHDEGVAQRRCGSKRADRRHVLADGQDLEVALVLKPLREALELSCDVLRLRVRIFRLREGSHPPALTKGDTRGRLVGGLLFCLWRRFNKHLRGNEQDSRFPLRLTVPPSRSAALGRHSLQILHDRIFRPVFARCSLNPFYPEGEVQRCGHILSSTGKRDILQRRSCAQFAWVTHAAPRSRTFPQVLLTPPLAPPDQA
mmetsp:Transcript_34281/g.80408  ORF Transcript_34281/g.80408 Transcript_34281/m.80408 type:complete len:327 (-) Transcript_34281:151-1131(-)